MISNDKSIIEMNENLSELEKENYFKQYKITEKMFESLFDENIFSKKLNKLENGLSYKATHAALLILLYRDQPILHNPYRLICKLIDLDELLTTWRYKHHLLAMRMIGGKTGTAEKINPSGGYYKKKNIVAFTGAFPMNDPQFIITIMIDNPKGQKFSFGYRTAGWVVAPIVKQLVTRIAPILGVKPQLESSPNFSNNLLDFKIRGKNDGANL